MPDTRQAATPTISRLLTDGTLIELIYDPAEGRTSFAVCAPDGTVSVEADISLPTGERLIPYSGSNNLIASGCVKLPSEVGDFRDKRGLVEEVRAFIRRYVHLTPHFEDVAAYYVLLTWVHDGFNELPYIRFRGDYGTGKTRALLVIGSLCYKAFFASGASTVSPIFHVLDAFAGTLVLDEADFRFSDATAELTKILNNGNMKGLPVLRTMTNRHKELSPTAFRVFGPKLIGMRHCFSDAALESRFLTEETSGRNLRSDIPIHLPDSVEVEALVLRNKLLAWRFAARRTVGVDPSRKIEGVEPRMNQTALALLSIIDDIEVRAAIAAELQATQEAVKGDRSRSIEGQVVEAIAEAFAIATGSSVSLSEVVQLLMKKNSDEFEVPITNKRLGWVVRTQLRIATRKSNGIYVIPLTERARVESLARRFGVVATRSSEADKTGVCRDICAPIESEKSRST